MFTNMIPKTKFFDPETDSILKLTLAVKTGFIVFVYIFSSFIPKNDLALKVNYYFQPANLYLGERLSAWDGQWYLHIVREGYPKNPAQAIDLARYVDFPLYPGLIKVISLDSFFSPQLTGICISLISSILSVLLLYKVATVMFNQNLAQKAAILFLFNPMGIFFVSIYSESLFFFLTLLTVYYALRDKWILVGMLGLLSVLTRSLGLLILIILIPMIIDRAKKTRNYLKLIIPTLSVFLIPLGFLLFSQYSQWQSGVPNTYSEAQKFFGRSAPSLNNLVNYSLTTTSNFSQFPLHGIFQSKLEVFTIIAVLILSVIYAKKVTWPLNLYNLSIILLTLSSGTSTAIIRYLAAAFPIYILLATAAKSETTYATIKYAFISLQALFAVMYVNWYWVS